MRITTNTHFKEIRAQLFRADGDGGAPFVTIDMVGGSLNGAVIFLNTEAEADELIKAAAEAKRLLALPTPMDRYDRQAHLDWHEQAHPGATEWPRQPRTQAEAAGCIAAYSKPAQKVNNG